MRPKEVRLHIRVAIAHINPVIGIVQPNEYTDMTIWFFHRGRYKGGFESLLGKKHFQERVAYSTKSSIPTKHFFTNFLPSRASPWPGEHRQILEWDMLEKSLDDNPKSVQCRLTTGVKPQVLHKCSNLRWVQFQIIFRFHGKASTCLRIALRCAALSLSNLMEIDSFGP